MSGSGRHRPLPPETPFVVFGDDWGRYVSTMQHTFRHIAKEHPVVWVNGIGHRVPQLTWNDLKRAWEKVRLYSGRPPEPRVDLSGGQPVAIVNPRVLPWHHWPGVYGLNARVLLRAVRGALAREGLDRPPVLVTGSPPAAGVVGRVGEIASLYYCMDDFLNFPQATARMMAPLERRLLQHVDAIVGTAAYLTEAKRPRSGRAYHLPQGVNYDHFSAPRALPPDLEMIPGPRIGFAGTVSHQCDLPLINAVADAFPDASVVLVGPVSLTEEQRGVLDRPNLHVLDFRPYRDLPAYVQGFDVGLIPYVHSKWTRSVDPLKLLEYLAAGIPVVTTDIREALKYRDEVAVEPSGPQFVEAVRRALAADRDAARVRAQGFAARQTWEHRARRFLDIAAEVVAARAAQQPAVATVA